MHTNLTRSSSQTSLSRNQNTVSDNVIEVSTSEEALVLKDDSKLFRIQAPKNYTFNYKAALAAFSNAVLYMTISEAGGGNIKKLLNWNSDSANTTIFCLSVGSSICYGMFTFKTFENLTLKPTSAVGWTLSALAPFAASTFLTGGIEGSSLLSIPNSAAVPIGVALFLLRCVSMADGAVKFQDRYQEILSSFQSSFKDKDFAELMKLSVAIYTAVGISVSSTDAVYSAIHKLASWFSLPESETLNLVCYIASGLGALGLLPMSLYWTQRGINQLTYGGKPDENGKVKDPTDKYTYLGAVGTIPVLLGILGAATATGGKVFSTLGTFSTVIRVSSSAGYSLFGGVPGLSTLFRGFAESLPDFGFSSSRRSISSSESFTSNHEEPLIMTRLEA